jgi:hypothetical protein
MVLDLNVDDLFNRPSISAVATWLPSWVMNQFDAGVCFVELFLISLSLFEAGKVSGKVLRFLIVVHGFGVWWVV